MKNKLSPSDMLWLAILQESPEFAGHKYDSLTAKLKSRNFSDELIMAFIQARMSDK